MEKELKVIKGNKRIDAYLAGIFPDYSRNYFQKLIKDGLVLLNGKKTEISRIPMDSDTINISFPEHRDVDFSNCPLDILHEDESILVINKQPGISVHSAGVNFTEVTIADIIARERKGITSQRLGIVHRLDKETSGVLVIAKNPKSQFSLMKQFKNRTVDKTYLALAHSTFTEKKGHIDKQITRDCFDKKKFRIGNGREAMTDFIVKEKFKNNSLLEVHPLTGRTHQIRVHLTSIGHPILGDKLYFTQESQAESEILRAKRHMLHAWKLNIIHPETRKEKAFIAKPPKDFSDTLNLLKKTAVLMLLITVAALNAYCAGPAKKTSSPSSTASAAAYNDTAIKQEIKILNTKTEKLFTDIEALNVMVEESSKTFTYEQSELKERVKEGNLALTDLNRKIADLQVQLERFKNETKIDKVKEQDKINMENIRKTNNAPAIELNVEEKLNDFQSNLELIKKDLSRIQEKIGIQQAKNAQETTLQEENGIEKIASYKWTPLIALGVAVLALIF
ncbi:MAG: hypothetical protein A2252_07550 [Elusimicrobia bacterium RIFOXYA2_FULL_39_19]|nr:MAG: hypothetical protein A2252_07550 [Elusimicrobia bacterium RIFOXYA2_FULL_39_19]